MPLFRVTAQVWASSDDIPHAFSPALSPVLLCTYKVNASRCFRVFIKWPHHARPAEGTLPPQPLYACLWLRPDVTLPLEWPGIPFIAILRNGIETARCPRYHEDLRPPSGLVLVIAHAESGPSQLGLQALPVETHPWTGL